VLHVLALEGKTLAAEVINILWVSGVLIDYVLMEVFFLRPSSSGHSFSLKKVSASPKVKGFSSVL